MDSFTCASKWRLNPAVTSLCRRKFPRFFQKATGDEISPRQKKLPVICLKNCNPPQLLHARLGNQRFSSSNRVLTDFISPSFKSVSLRHSGSNFLCHRPKSPRAARARFPASSILTVLERFTGACGSAVSSGFQPNAANSRQRPSRTAFTNSGS